MYLRTCMGVAEVVYGQVLFRFGDETMDRLYTIWEETRWDSVASDIENEIVDNAEHQLDMDYGNSLYALKRRVCGYFLL